MRDSEQDINYYAQEVKTTPENLIKHLKSNSKQTLGGA